MHDWPDAYASKILMKLREVAQRDTRLILIDSIMPFACHDSSADEGKGVPGAVPKEAPQPLLANYGVANEMGYNGDLTVCQLSNQSLIKHLSFLLISPNKMLLAFNSQERTIRHLQQLLKSTGWRLIKVSRDLSNSFLQPVEAVPMF